MTRLSPKLWIRLKRSRMRKEGYHTKSRDAILTSQRKSPTAATMRLSVCDAIIDYSVTLVPSSSGSQGVRLSQCIKAGGSPKTMKRWLSRGLPYFQEGPRTKVLIAPEDIRMFLTKRQMAKSDLDTMVEETFKELRETGS